MALYAKIRAELKDAMLKKEAVRLSVVRSLTAAFTNELIAKKAKPDSELSDEEVLTLIRRSVKQHKDSVEQFRKGNRNDLVAAEEAELKILEAYLPQMMGEDEIARIVAMKKNELGATDKTKIGILMAAVMKELKGKADGAVVKKLVERVFL